MVNADAVLAEWKWHPEVFVREAMGLDGTVPGPIGPLKATEQHLELFRAVGKMARAKWKYKEVLEGLRPRSDLTEEDTEQVNKQGISVMSGKGPGKGFAGSMLIDWFLLMHPRCKSPITGPSYEQVRKGLMAEIHKWLNYKDPRTGKPISIVADEFEVQRDMIFLKKEGNQSRFFAVRTAPPSANEEQQKSTLDGWHEEAMMVVVDEAAGVGNGVFNSFRTTLTRPFNFAIIFFNPTRNEGFAYDTHFGKEREAWVQIHWDSRDSPLVTEAQIQSMIRDFGEDGPEYRINVLGLPPKDDPTAMIPRTWIQSAIDRYEDDPDPEKTWENHPVIAGFDPGGGGADKSAYVSRKGKRVKTIDAINEPDFAKLGDWVFQKMREDEVDILFIDTVGIGAPMLSYMKKDAERNGFKSSQIRAADVRRTALNTKYFRMRDQAWWDLRKLFQDGEIQMPNNSKLKNQLGAIRQGKLNSKGETTVETKEQMKARGVASPNEGDALMMTMFAAENSLLDAKRAAAGIDDYDDEPDDPGVSWMGR